MIFLRNLLLPTLIFSSLKLYFKRIDLIFKFFTFIEYLLILSHQFLIFIIKIIKFFLQFFITLPQFHQLFLILHRILPFEHLYNRWLHYFDLLKFLYHFSPQRLDFGLIVLTIRASLLRMCFMNRFPGMCIDSGSLH